MQKNGRIAVRLLACLGFFVAAAGAALAYVEGFYVKYSWLVLHYRDRALQLAIIAAVAVPAQLLLPAMRKPPKIRSYEFWLDLVYWAQGFWLTILPFFDEVNALAAGVLGPSDRYWFPQLRELPYWLQVLLAVWAFDFAVYWRHRLEHSFSVLWSFHAVHHTAEKVDFLTTTRLHPFEIGLGMFVNAAVLRLGFEPLAAAVGFAIYLHFNFYIHTNVRVRYPGFLKYVFVSPFMHQWHHAPDPAAAGKNVGVVFAFHDWLFGTAYHPDRWPDEYGLGGSEREQVPQSYVRHLVYPLQYLHARLANWQARRTARTIDAP